jgi:hypothetical protein
VTFFNGQVGVARLKFMGVGSELSAEKMVATSSGLFDSRSLYRQCKCLPCQVLSRTERLRDLDCSLY